MPLPLGRYYGSYVGNIALQPGDFIIESSSDNITAGAGGGPAGAFRLTTQTSRIATVATIGDSVMLPLGVAGLELMIINHGANAMQVYGTGTDVIDDQLVSIGVAQMSFSFVLYACASDGRWYTEGLSSGFAPSLGLQTFSYANITANAGNTQATGTLVTTMLANVAAAGAGSVTLPASAPGLEITVHNTSAFTTLVFPSAGGTTTEKINAGAANAAQTMVTNTSTVYTCTVAGQWYSVPRIPS